MKENPVFHQPRTENLGPVIERIAIITAIGRERRRGEKRHLPEGQRDHDEIHALSPDRNRARQHRKQCGGGNRHGQHNGDIGQPMRIQNGDGIGANPHRRRMPKAGEAGPAHQEGKRNRRCR